MLNLKSGVEPSPLGGQRRLIWGQNNRSEGATVLSGPSWRTIPSQVEKSTEG